MLDGGAAAEVFYETRGSPGRSNPTTLPRKRHAGTSPKLRALQQAPCLRRPPRPASAVTRHFLCRLRRYRPRQRLSQLVGGFVLQPVRPARNWKNDNYLGKDAASTRVKHRPVDVEAHTRFAAAIRGIPPAKRLTGAARPPRTGPGDGRPARRFATRPSGSGSSAYASRRRRPCLPSGPPGRRRRGRRGVRKAGPSFRGGFEGAVLPIP